MRYADEADNIRLYLPGEKLSVIIIIFVVPTPDSGNTGDCVYDAY